MPLPRCRSRVRVAERRGRGRVVLAAAASMGNYVVPLDAASSGITLPLVEILRDLNKRVPETIVLPASRCASASDPVIPWYRANRMLSFYAPGWCGEVRDVIYNDNGKVTVVYRVTIRGIDGEEPEYIERLDGDLIFGSWKRKMMKCGGYLSPCSGCTP